MKIQRCPQGHYYDGDIYSHCPHCGVVLSVNVADIVATKHTSANDEDKTLAMSQVDDDITIAGDVNTPEDRTIGIYTSLFNGKPIVGWLVCCSGPERGRDYRLYPAKNRIGRSLRSEVVICDDREICRENHMAIVYEPRKNEFYAVAGSGISYVNDSLLDNSKSLKAGDILKLGASQFEFVPYCVGERKWDLKK